MELYLDCEDNSKVFVNEKVVEGECAVILIHGLAEHSGRYSAFIEALNRNNISVFAMDLRGHGKSIGKRGDVESINKVLFDVELVYKHILKNFNFKKVGVFGHSIGGLVASLFVGRHCEVNFLVLTSPAIYLPKKANIIKFLPYKLLPFVRIKKKFIKSKEPLEVSKKDELSLQTISLRTFGAFFCEGLKQLNPNKISCPVLFMYGEQDQILSEHFKFVEFFNMLESEDKKLICYKEAKHRIVQNENADSHVQEIISWIANR